MLQTNWRLLQTLKTQIVRVEREMKYENSLKLNQQKRQSIINKSNSVRNFFIQQLTRPPFNKS